jgi:hypothetical protein
VLWNIDSMDWRKKITPAAMRGRIVSLMLVWRRGIVLFHDVHEIVQRALPAIVHDLEGSGVEWLDCARHPI